MKRYLLNVTFYAGSNDAEDTDRNLFILCVDKDISEQEMIETFRKVNWLLDTFNQENGEAEFPISYEQGLNINTLMEGIGIYTNGKVTAVYGNCGNIESVDNYYVIEQWQ